MKKNSKKTNSSMKFFVYGIVLIIILIILILFSANYYYRKKVFSPLSTADEILYINIKEGETRDQIAQKLVDLGFLPETKWFILYMRISKDGGDIRAGSHKLNKTMNIPEIIESLESEPEIDTVWVTLPEGLRHDEIAEILSGAFSSYEKSVFQKSRFLELVNNPDLIVWSKDNQKFIDEYLPEDKPLEGFLYPDTYNFKVEATEDNVINTLVTTLFTSKLGDKGLEMVENSEYSFYEILTVASMIERESFTDEESFMIADIMYRRLEGGYYLGIDATSLYPLKDWKAVLTAKILKDPNPYNTRVNYGLPPTPIANPGYSTIDAALNPKKNEYLYYLHDLDGNIHYAKTNAGHEENKTKYL